VSIKEKIQKDGRLVSKEPTYLGKPKIPISCGLLFPNINKYEYMEKGLEKIIGTEKIFFWDDLHSASDICCDTSDQCFLKALKERFSPMFPFKITVKERLLWTKDKNIYHRKQSWKDLGIQVKGRVHRVSYVYRSTRELYEFSSRFIGANGGPPVSSGSKQYGMFLDLYEYHGPKPQIRQFLSMEEIIAFVCDTIKKLVDKGECFCSDIAILYTIKSTQDSPEIHILHMIGKAQEKTDPSYLGIRRLQVEEIL
jgi:hypothetical protein